MRGVKIMAMRSRLLTCGSPHRDVKVICRFSRPHFDLLLYCEVPYKAVGVRVHEIVTIEEYGRWASIL